MFNKRPDNSSIGTVKKNSNPDTMTNAEILQAIEIMMDAPEEEMNTDRIEEYLSILQSRTPVTEEYDSEVQWAKLEEAHPLAFEDSSQLEEMTPSFSARKEELHHVRHIHMLTRGAGVAAAVIVLSTVTANALGFHPIHAILQWAEGIVQVCINPSGTMELPDNTPSEYAPFRVPHFSPLLASALLLETVLLPDPNRAVATSDIFPTASSAK